MRRGPYCVSVFTSRPADLKAIEDAHNLSLRSSIDPYWCPWGHVMEYRFQFVDAGEADAFLVEAVSNPHEACRLPCRDNPNFVHDAYSTEWDDWTGLWFVVIRENGRVRVWCGNMTVSFRDAAVGWSYTLRRLARVDPELVAGGGAFPLFELSSTG
jgi:hypothetical protein